jgi:hypothetical protein
LIGEQGRGKKRLVLWNPDSRQRVDRTLRDDFASEFDHTSQRYTLNELFPVRQWHPEENLARLLSSSDAAKTPTWSLWKCVAIRTQVQSSRPLRTRETPVQNG